MASGEYAKQTAAGPRGPERRCDRSLSSCSRARAPGSAYRPRGVSQSPSCSDAGLQSAGCRVLRIVQSNVPWWPVRDAHRRVPRSRIADTAACGSHTSQQRCRPASSDARCFARSAAPASVVARYGRNRCRRACDESWMTLNIPVTHASCSDTSSPSSSMAFLHFGHVEPGSSTRSSRGR